MKIWAYVTVWNEEKMLPYYLRHYSKFCERIIVLDNQSTDSTLMICKEYPNVDVREYNTSNTFNDYVHLDLKHRCITEAKGKADYIIVSDCDEFIYHPNIIEFLKENKSAVIFPAGFQMVSNYFPTGDGQIYDEIKDGVPDPWYSKPILINPNKIKKLEWIEGCHEIKLNSELDGEILHPVPVEIRPTGEWNGHPWGRWKMQYDILETFNNFPIKLLHYKFMGAEYVRSKYTQYSIRNSEQNKIAGLANHYDSALVKNNIENEIDLLKRIAINVNC
jgi:glycosyltransferase involved in cell wall biosynthesis